MHSFLDSRIMAKALRAALAERNISVTHADSLELVARQFGLKDWNTLSAAIDRASAERWPLPRGWYRTGTTDPAIYRMGLDPGAEGVLMIESVARPAPGPGVFGSLAETVPADDFRGGKLRLDAELAGQDCGTAAIWMRIDPKDGGRPLRFDNLIDRAGEGPLAGTFGWTARHIVLDVPDAADRILYGVLLVGSGTLRARNVRLAPAAPDSTRTDYPRHPDLGFGGVAAA